MQAILTLVHIRRTHHLFPLRPYLPHLIDALEDTDPAVRECARQSVVELFTGPGATDAARADLKKEMTKKGVRKTIVDGVLSKVLSGSAGTSTPATMSEAVVRPATGWGVGVVSCARRNRGERGRGGRKGGKGREIEALRLEPVGCYYKTER